MKKENTLRVTHNAFRTDKPKEFLKRNPPVFDESEEVRISFWNKWIKFNQIEKVK